MRNKKEDVNKILSSIPDYIKKIKCDAQMWMKPFKCAVSSCPNTFIKNTQLPYKFHSFPGNPDLRSKWSALCSLPPGADTTNLMVCSSHFLLDDYERNYKEEFRNPNHRRLLKESAAPSKQLTGPAVTSLFDLDPTDVKTNDAVVKAQADENEELRETVERLETEEKSLRTKLKVLQDKVKSKRGALNSIRGKSRSCRKTSTECPQRNILSKVFTDAQINVLRGKPKTVWQDDDLAMAFSLRQMSSRTCYLYLKYKLNIPLPSLSAVQKWAASSGSTV